jgi:hypothetical protein
MEATIYLNGGEREVDLADIGAGVILVLIVYGIIFGITVGGTYVACATFVGVDYDVTVVVQAVEKSNHFGPHTNVWAQVYGEQDITYVLIGHHDLEVSQQYHIKFVDEIYWYWWFILLTGEVRGRVQLIEPVGVNG